MKFFENPDYVKIKKAILLLQFQGILSFSNAANVFLWRKDPKSRRLKVLRLDNLWVSQDFF
ncbi:MAG: hypothetical protein WCA84_09290 [Ignavibacteriaceae bacterium]